ncbi:MAG TPA: UDP-N-acetylglucosamine 2-epimerase (non-hydrolyzing) [Candidatus Omnitrophota bacterium]|nr:UDP-N-acetylglucosamine 2-epimerase (non-hydrolyzing) [Candidatus Omnitrophota bacterium]
MRKKILIAFGTRPEAIKFVPLIHALNNSREFETHVCLTGQHRQMVDQVIRFFKIKVDEDLHLMRTNQTLAYVSGRVITRFGEIIRRRDPDLVFVQGDTATALMVGIACFYARKPLAHLEAGLRTFNKFQPFPEEMNRSLLSHIADIHFTPTRTPTRNLLKERIPAQDIYQVGNTVVDTVSLASKYIHPQYPIFRELDPQKRILFVTAHRRESFGQGLNGIFHAIKKIAQRFPDVEIVYPVHLNPNVFKPAHQILGGIQRVHLTRPLTYEETFWMLRHCYLVLTDSGGIQEEAPSFQKPVLVLRNVTERTEGIHSGVARLVGTDTVTIVRETTQLLVKPQTYAQMRSKTLTNPYGDGKACERILRIISKYLDGKSLSLKAKRKIEFQNND